MSLQPENDALMTEASEISEPVIDTVINVVIKDDGMTACVNLSPPSEGGAGITLEDLKTELAKHRVTQNLDIFALNALVMKPVYDKNFTVATGTKPIHGEDGYATFKVRTEKVARPKEVEDDKVDFYDLGIIENVNPGQLLCVITPPTAGYPGQTVQGDKVLQKPGKAVAIMAGPNTEMSADGLQISSKIAGQFEFNGKKITVNETYTLSKDVDTSTGNIKVNGNLIIRGTVTSGFSIEAGGFINVTGIVDSATVTAGKDINLQGGAIGCTINCGGNLKSKFIENCTAFARGEIWAEYVLNSNIRGKRSLKTDGAIARILGGTYVIMQNLHCRTIGSAAGVKTKIEIGNDPDLITRQKELQELIPDLEKQIGSLEPLIKMLYQLEATGRLDDEKRAMLEKAKNSLSSHTNTLEKSKKELESINYSLINKNYGKIVCTGTIYPGTDVKIGSATYTVTHNLVNTSLYYNEGEVAFGSAR